MKFSHTKMMAILILFSATSALSRTYECRLYENQKIGIYLEIDESKMIDPSGYVHKKIGTNDGIDVYRF